MIWTKSMLKFVMLFSSNNSAISWSDVNSASVDSEILIPLMIS